MDYWPWVIAGVALCLVTLGIVLLPADSTIPPTRAFSKIKYENFTYYSPSYDGSIILNHTSGFLVDRVSSGVQITVGGIPYMQISDLTTQNCPLLPTVGNITINTNDEIRGFIHSTTTRTNEIIIPEDGVYMIMAVPQIGEATTQADGVHNFWMTINNTQVPNTNIRTTILLQVGQTETFTTTLNWVGFLQEHDIISFQQSCTDSDIGIIFTNGSTRPNTPSIIISAYKLGR